MSVSLQNSVRFLRVPLPASRSRSLRSAYHCSSPCSGESQVYHVSRPDQRRLGLVYPPRELRSRYVIKQHIHLSLYLLVQAYQHLWLVCYDDGSRDDSHSLTMLRTFSHLHPWCWEGGPSRGHRNRCSRFSCRSIPSEVTCSHSFAPRRCQGRPFERPRRTYGRKTVSERWPFEGPMTGGILHYWGYHSS